MNLPATFARQRQILLGRKRETKRKEEEGEKKNRLDKSYK